MHDTTVVFRTASSLEAAMVRGLLDAQGIESLLTSDGPQALFPTPAGSMGEVRVEVAAEVADEAVAVIEAYHTGPASSAAESTSDEVSALDVRLGYTFVDRSLLVRALTHRSRAHEDAAADGDEVGDNESLEFLGDAVLGLIAADLLFRRFPNADEGLKSKMKSALVAEPSLASVAERLGLGGALRLGRGEERSGGRQKSAVIADACEAVIAAIYLDGGFGAAQAFVEREFAGAIDALHGSTGVTALTGDFKSALQERLQAVGIPLPEYRLVGTEGPDHRKVFEVEVRSQGEVLASAQGGSKKEAEQRAAQLALDRLA